MLKILLLFSLVIQNVRTQHNGCNCHKLSNMALSQLLSNSYINSRPSHNVQSIPSNIGLAFQNGPLTSKLNGLNVNNIGTGTEFLLPSNLAPNRCTESANDVLKANLPAQIANNAVLNDLLAHAISVTTSKVPTIKSAINNKLLNNGVQYNIGIQIDKKDLLNKIMNNKCAYKGNMEVSKLLGDTVSILNNMDVDRNDYKIINMVNPPINNENPYTNNDILSNNVLTTLHGIQNNNGIPHIEKRTMGSDSPITNMVLNFDTPNKIQGIESHIPFGSQTFIQYDMGLQSNNRKIEQIVPTNNLISSNYQNNPNINTLTNVIYDNFVNNALLNNPQAVNNPLLDTLISNTMPMNIQFDNNANTGNSFHSNLNVPNIVLNDLINNAQIPLNNVNNGMQMPNVEMGNSGNQYTDVSNFNGLPNSFDNTNTGEYITQVPLNAMVQTNQLSDMPIIGNINYDQLYNLPAMINVEESLGNIPLNMQTILSDFSILNLGQFGCLPIINGLPVAAITETVTVMNPNI